jgi:hypothetical protein
VCKRRRAEACERRHARLHRPSRGTHVLIQRACVPQSPVELCTPTYTLPRASSNQAGGRWRRACLRLTITAYTLPWESRWSATELSRRAARARPSTPARPHTQPRQARRHTLACMHARTLTRTNARGSPGTQAGLSRRAQLPRWAGAPAQRPHRPRPAQLICLLERPRACRCVPVLSSRVRVGGGLSSSSVSQCRSAGEGARG